ncbi:hypothetical protein C8N43_1652 [Litoreibacter ponti]|uniref:Asparagine synthase n=1 Tax=Litoreibacter ponti TaxID=1510457 RepID=A0A2T6BLX5_9RHOB|nr:hypothetical protein [Litoreibacter ponti]PTX56987.1 hypothetical protein C8N43_1652 [Litoreibacter ponti]
MITAPLAAQTACGHAGLSFARTFRTQFTLSQSPDLQIDGYRVTELGAWRLHHCRALPYARIHDHGGAMVAIVLGIAVDGAGQRVGDGHKLSFGETPEAFVTQCAGRYVVLTPDAAYSDPSGSMGGVFDASTRTVASTVLMCLDRPPTAPEGFDAKAVMSGKGAYSLGYTRDHAVRAIPPNHRLNLDDFTLTRFWPTADEDFAEQDTIPQMATRLSAIIGAIARSTPTLLPLTGGRDSRNLAACAKPHLEHLQGSFTYVMNWQGTIDAELAQTMAQTLGLPHTTYTSWHEGHARKTLSNKARRRQKMAFRLAGGYVGDANNEVMDGLCQQIPRGVVLRGNVMEIVKANHWKRGLARDGAHPDGVDLDYATARLAINHAHQGEAVARFRPEYAAWYDALPDAAKPLHYDLAFVEHLLPGWQPKFYGYTRNFFVNPFSDRALIAAAMRLPVKARQANHCNDALLAHAAPELAAIPFTPDLKKARRKVA